MLAALAPAAIGQYRCNVNGLVVYQDVSCNAPSEKSVVLEEMSAAELQTHFEHAKRQRGAPVREPKGEELFVPSDPGATYVILDVVRAQPDGRMREVSTKRIGRAGHVSYALRLYDCRHDQVKYLSTGDTYQSLKVLKPDPALSSIVLGSIAWYVGQTVCK